MTVKNSFKLAIVIGLGFGLAACSKDEEVPVEVEAPAPVVEPETGDGRPNQPETGGITEDATKTLSPLEAAGEGQNGIDTFAGSLVYFAYDSAELSAEARDALAKQAEWMNFYRGAQITIEGHCDERGTREYNLALGERRASAVKDYLVALGVSAGRVRTISYGKERPVVMGGGDTVWAQNRRGKTSIR